MVKPGRTWWTLVVVLGALEVGCGGSGSGGGYFPANDAGPDSASGGASGSGGGAGSGGAGTGGGGASGGGGAGGSAGAGGGAGAGASGGAGAGAGGAGGTGGGGTGGVAGSCAGSGDCAGPTPHCLIATGACVGCLATTHCASGERCAANTCVPDPTCANSLGCVGSPLGTICDPVTKKCVECAQPADCSGTADCVANVCVPYTECQSSLDCPLGQVCDQSAGRCWDCVGDLDCTGGAKCIAHECVQLTPCQSDNECTPLGKLCDTTLGHCVDCMGDTGCDPSQHCTLGACVADVCAGGASRCEGNARATCATNGSGWGAPGACAAQTTCTETSGAASCTPWACTAGQTYCEGSAAVTCSADGLVRVSEVDCAATSQICSAGACTSQVCVPDTIFCAGAQVRQCNSAGTTATVLDLCDSDEYCRAVPAPASCVQQVCPAGQLACDGDVLRTCNAEGSGFLPGGTSCAPNECVAGACTTCPPNPVEDLRIVEVFLGSTDYVVLENRGACSVDVGGLLLVVRTSAGTAEDLAFTLPARVLGPNEQLVVTDTATAAGDVQPPENIYLTDSSGENVLLCDGVCSSTTVLDAFRHASGATPPALPTGISFAGGPKAGITASNVETHAYVRAAWAGSAPAFTSGDWSVGAASRAGSGPTCPVAQPAEGSSCSPLGATCAYAAVTCSCLFVWSCS